MARLNAVSPSGDVSHVLKSSLKKTEDVQVGTYSSDIPQIFQYQDKSEIKVHRTAENREP